MPIQNVGWEFHIIRDSEQARAKDGKRRTVGRYQVFHEGIAQTAPGLSGAVAETRGPGANHPAGNHRRVEEGRYPLFTQDGENYVTIGYVISDDPADIPKPGIELKNTEQRSEILIHPGHGFLSSIGCINPCTSLPDADELIDFAPSRRRVIAIIENMKSFFGSGFPKRNGLKIDRAFVVIDGEPDFTG